MATGSYTAALRAVLRWEGGWSNHPSDPGGATMRGVTQRVYDAWRAAQGRGHQSVRAISDAELLAIYRNYADKIAFDSLPAGIDLAVFDAAVNSGPERAGAWLQRALGGLVVDGIIGPATQLAANSAPDKAAVIRRMQAIRLAFVRRLKTWSVFGEGWSNRIADIEARALAMAGGGPAPVASVADARGKSRARIEDAKPRPSKKMADATIGAGVATAGAGGALTEAKDALAPLAGNGGWIDAAIAGLALGGAALAIGGLVWRWWKRREAEAYAADLGLPEQVVS